MQVDKRTWCYLGLGVPSGRALARPVASDRLRHGDRVLLVGGTLVHGLYPPLERLAAGSRIQLEALALSGSTTSDWAEAPWLAGLLRDYRPDAILWVLDPTACGADALQELADDLDVRVSCWLPPVGGVRARSTRLGPPRARVVRPDSALLLPTAVGYAGWAGYAWSVVTGTW